MQKIAQKQIMPRDLNPENVRTSALKHPRTLRQDHIRAMTTGFGGKFLPVFVVPLLREDRMLGTTFRFGIQMAETADMLMNPVRVKATVWVVPKLAFERFKDLGHLNRSYAGEKEIDDSVTPWFNFSSPDDGGAPTRVTKEFYKTLGMHNLLGQPVNSDYLEAYNCIWNYVATQTSTDLTPRTATDDTLAPAFWMHSAMKHVKPKFDEALIHGEVPLTVSSAQLPVTGLGFSADPTQSNQTVTATGGVDDIGQYSYGSGGIPNIKMAGARAPEVFAELQDNGITVSLANIELAKKTAAFARIMTDYQGIDEDFVIDALMSGIRMPEEGMKRPQLLGETETTIGMSQRYATDSGNLDKSVTNGQTFLDVRAMVPQLNTGGIVMGIVEILPEQIYERRMDMYAHAYTVESLPERIRDELDAEPVDVVHNMVVDTDHAQPNDVFGYEPLNAKWQRNLVTLGGLYYRPDGDAAWNENRNRVWASENEDPVLGDDYYLATNLHHEVFADAQTDPFEVSVVGMAQIEGNTYFGPGLREARGEYDKVAAKADYTRIDQDA